MVPPPAVFDVAAFSLGAIIGGRVGARRGARVRTVVVVGPGGLGLTPAAPRALLRLEPGMAPEAVRHVHRENLRTLMLARPESADDLAVTLQIDNVRRARFKSGAIPVSDVLFHALPAVRAHLAGIWGARDAFTSHHLEESRRGLGAPDPRLDLRVVDRARPWVKHEAAQEGYAPLSEMLAPRAPGAPPPPPRHRPPY